MSSPPSTTASGKHRAVESEGNGDVNLLTPGTGSINFHTNAAKVGSIDSSGNLNLTKVGAGIKIKEGTNATMGAATLSNGDVVVSTTKITASSRVLLSVQAALGIPGELSKANVIAGTSFNIISTSAADNSTVAWQIVEPS